MTPRLRRLAAPSLLLVLLAPAAHAAPLRGGSPALVQAAAVKRADLTVSAVGKVPAALRASQAFTATATVRNAGRKPAKASAVRFYLSADAKRDRADVRLLGVVATKALKPRKAARGRARLTTPGTLAGGSYRLLACADDLGKVKEGAKEANNCRAAAGAVRVAGQGVAGTTGSGGPAATGATSAPPPTVPPAAGGPGSSDPVPGGSTDPDPTATPVPTPPPGDDGPPAHPNQPTPLDSGAATSMADATAFLYEGSNAPQQGVPAGAISPKRVAVVHGRVLGEDEQPLAGVRVSVLHHAEYGRTWTNADGVYDLAVNGAELDLVYEHDGFLPMQQQVTAPWQDYMGADDVVMTKPDPTVTKLDPASTAPFQVARGSAGGGNAPATLLFPRGVRATLEMPDGSTKPSPGMSVRATEFPAGSRETLPGTMPENVGPTYAAEFSLDEAIAAGAESVGFDKPVLNYTPNFIKMPVGGVVPTGYYDRGKGQWIPGPNGLVIKIVEIRDGFALVDADGTPGGDSDADLAKHGISPDERAQLAKLFKAGDELWRVPIQHFTPWDHNFPFGLPKDAKPPKLKEFEWKDPNDPCNKSGSIIACESQTLSEELPVAGTSMHLRYDSNRQPGYTAGSKLTVPVTGGAIPAKLQGAEAVVEIAGKRITKRWCDPDHATTSERICAGFDKLTKNLDWDVAWDGTDAFGRPVQGRPVATVTVTYVYEFNYYESPADLQASFGSFPEDSNTVVNGAGYCGNQNPSRDNEQIRLSHFFCGILATQTIRRPLGPWDADGVDGLGGLTLSAHHGYDPNEQVVHRGDGGTIRAKPLGDVTRSVVGAISGPFPGTTPTSSTKTDIDYLTAVAVGPDGSVYGHSGLNQNTIWRSTPDGRVTRIGGVDPAAEGYPYGDPTGDGGPATAAILGDNDTTGMDVGPDGSVFFGVGYVSSDAAVIRRIRPDGIIETVAGRNYARTDKDNGDGGPAKDAKLASVGDIDVAPDGSIYFTELARDINGWKELVRRITPEGTITTVAGGGTDNAADDQDLGDGEPARDAQFDRLRGVYAADDGSVYVADYGAKVVDRIGTDGRIRRVVGDHTTGIELGNRGADAAIGQPVSLAMDREGRLLVRTYDRSTAGSEIKLLTVAPDGLVTPLAGRDTSPRCGSCLSADGELAANTMIESHSTGIEALPDGRILYADGRRLVRVIEPALPGFTQGDVSVPSSDGSELYLFDRQGRHLETRDTTTGARLETFGYDAAKRLVSLTDVDGNVTRIERDGDGRPTAIVAPGGQRTTLTLDAAGRVKTVADPGGNTTMLGYDATGLLKTFARPGRPAATMAYDAAGRLVSDTSPTGAQQTLARTETEQQTTVKVTSGEGRVTTYVTEALDNGDRRRAIVRPSGATTELLVKPDGRKVRTSPDGTKTTYTTAPDPRFGSAVPYTASEVVTTPGGHTMTAETTRSVTLSNPSDQLSVDEISTRTTRAGADGKTQTIERSYDGGTRKLTTEVSGGTTSEATLDAKGRVATFDADGPGRDDLAPVGFTFDGAGHMTRVAQGTGAWTLTYDARNRLATRTDVKGRVTRFGYDDADRETSMELPSHRTYRYAYEPDGTRRSTTLPSGASFTGASDDAGRDLTVGLPGGGGAFTRLLDKDGAIKRLTMPSGAVTTTAFDAAGREQSTDHGTETDVTGYQAGTDEPASLTRTIDGGTPQSVALTRDGMLPKTTTVAGGASGTFTYAFDDLFRLTGVKLTSGGDTVDRTLAYDGAGRPTKVGPFTLTRGGMAGAVSALADDKLSAAYGYDAAGRLGDRTMTAGGGARYRNQLTWGTTGQLEGRTETVAGGGSRSLAYGYDDDGQLTSVKQDGAVVERYGYDTDGNRTSSTLGGAPAQTATYDAQGRQKTLGSTAYGFDADGFLQSRGADTFAYGRSGALLSARVGGVSVAYASDAMGRRTARTTAAGTEGYLYGDPGNPWRVTAARGSDGVLNEYTYDDEGALVAIQRGDTRFYVGTDQVGSPRVVFKADGTVVKRIDYTAFGVAADKDPAWYLPIGFGGGLADASTGLVRLGWRDYDAAAGRFTARDPLLFGGSPVNLYAYVNSDPASLRDPTGLWCVGGSLYDVIGGGSQFCHDGESGKSSLCVEGGIGVGGGLSVDPFAGVQSETFAAFAEVTGKYGPAGVTVGGEVDLNCFNAKAGISGTVGPVTVGIDTTGDKARQFGGGGLDDFNGKGIHDETTGSWGTKLEGKIGLKGCWAN